MRLEETRKDEKAMSKKTGVLLAGIIVILFGAVIVGVFTTTSPTIYDSELPTTGFDTTQNRGEVYITINNVARLDAVELVGLGGTRSMTMRGNSIHSGIKFELRSNEEVINYLNSANITVPTSSGTKTVENVSDLPSEYQKTPDGFVNPDADIGNYDNASVATVACLYIHGGFETSGKHIPANVSIPCNTPVLTQTDSFQLGTSTERNGNKVTTPIILKEGEYRLIGTNRESDEETVILSVHVDEDIVGK